MISFCRKFYIVVLSIQFLGVIMSYYDRDRRKSSDYYFYKDLIARLDKLNSILESILDCMSFESDIGEDVEEDEFEDGVPKE